MKDIKVNFYLAYDKENDAGCCPVMVRSRHNSTKLIRRGTGEICKPSEWSDSKGTAKDVVLKSKLAGLEKRIHDIYEELSTRNPSTTLEHVMQVINGSDNRHVPKSTRVVDWVDHYLKNSPNNESYTRGVRLLKVHMKGKHDLTFDQLSQTRIDSLCKALADKGKSSNTILKVLKFIKQVAKMAQDEGVRVGSLNLRAPKSYHRKARTEIRLTFDEIKKIQEVKLTDPNEQRARDLFLVQCFTGLRHVDVIRLTSEHINLRDGFICIRQQKTGNEVCVTLHKYSLPIINKYLKDAAAAAHSEAAAPLFAHFKQQYYNRALKSIAEEAKLSDSVREIVYSGPKEVVSDKPKHKLMKSHTGRRSFARLLSNMGLEESIIAEELGHNSISVTRHYIGSSEHVARMQTVRAAWNRIEKMKGGKAIMKIA